MTPAELCKEAARRGLHLEPRGDKLAVTPASHCPPDFAETLRAHKGQLMAWLEGRAAGLWPDQAPWLHVARQVNEGQFDGGTISELQSVEKGLRSIVHPTIAAALLQLNALLKRKGAKPTQP